jgi:hypothetical protein
MGASGVHCRDSPVVASVYRQGVIQQVFGIRGNDRRKVMRSKTGDSHFGCHTGRVVRRADGYFPHSVESLNGASLTLPQQTSFVCQQSDASQSVTTHILASIRIEHAHADIRDL